MSGADPQDSSRHPEAVRTPVPPTIGRPPAPTYAPVAAEPLRNLVHSWYGLAALLLLTYACHPLAWREELVSVWSPVAGLALVLTAWFGRRFAAAVVMGTGLLLMLRYASAAGPTSRAALLSWILVEAGLTSLESAGAWWLYHHPGRGHRRISDPRSAMVFVLGVAGAAAWGSALLRAAMAKLLFSSDLDGPLADASLPLLALQFWLERALGLLVVAPPVLVLLTPWLKRRGLLPPGQLNERSIGTPESSHPSNVIKAGGRGSDPAKRPPDSAASAAPDANAGEPSRRDPRPAGGVPPWLGDALEVGGLALCAGAICYVMGRPGAAVTTGPQLWGVQVLLIVWAGMRQGLRGGALVASLSAAVPLVLRRISPEPPSWEAGMLQAHLIGQCAAGLLVSTGLYWVQLRETGYREVVAQVPVVIYSARLTRPGRTRPSEPRPEAPAAGVADIVLVSAAGAKILHEPAEDLLGDYGRWLDKVHPDDREVVLAALDQLARQTQPVICEYRRVAARPDDASGVSTASVSDLVQSPPPRRLFGDRGDRATQWLRDTMAPQRDYEARLVGWEGVIIDITEQRRLADDLRRTTNMFHALISNLPTGVFFVQGSHGRPILVNARARQLLGQREDASVGVEQISRAYRLFRADGTTYPAEELPVFLALREGRTTMRDDIIVHQPNGRRMPLVTWAAPVSLGGKGTPDAAVWVLEDLTALHQAEAARKETEGRMRAVIETMAEGLVVVDAAGLVVTANPAASQMLQRRPDRLLGRPLFDDETVVLRETHDEMPRDALPVEVVLRHGRPVRNLVLGLRRREPKADDSPEKTTRPVRWVLTNAMPLAGAGAGAAGSVVMILSDITALVQAREAMRRSEGRYRGLLESLPVMIVESDAALRNVYANPATKEITGYDLDEIAEPAVWGQVIHPEDLPRVIEMTRAAGNGEVRRGEIRYRAKSGEEKVTFLISQPRYEGGEIVGVVSVMMDLTRERRLERELLRSQRLELVGRLSSGVAHDFNNVLFVVMNLTELALNNLPDGHPVRDELRRISDAADQANGLVEQLLAMGRQKPASPKQIDLNAGARRTLDLLRTTLPRGVAVEARLHAEALPVLADETQFQQVLMNLCLNARDAMPHGGRLTVTTAADPKGFAVLRVSDSGVGMGEDVRVRIFEPFFSTKEGGTGLGLAIVQQIVESYGGSVAVESEPQRGTTFEVRWPTA